MIFRKIPHSNAKTGQKRSSQLPNPEKAVTGKAKILIVENDMPTMLFMTHILTRVGYDVEIARTGAKAIKMASEHKFDAIAVNVRLPDSTGFAICDQLKQLHISRKTPLALIHSSITDQDKARGFAIGVADFIAKPVEPTDFIYRIISLVKRQPQHHETVDKG